MRIDSIARMPTMPMPNSRPAAKRASKRPFAYSIGKCSSQPSSPMKFTRSA